MDNKYYFKSLCDKTNYEIVKLEIYFSVNTQPAQKFLGTFADCPGSPLIFTGRANIQKF